MKEVFVAYCHDCGRRWEDHRFTGIPHVEHRLDHLRSAMQCPVCRVLGYNPYDPMEGLPNGEGAHPDGGLQEYMNG